MWWNRLKNNQHFGMREIFITNRLQKQEGKPRRLRAGGFEVGVPLSRLAEFFSYIKSGPPGYPALSESEVMFYGHVGASGPHVSWTVSEDTPAEKRIQSIREARRLEKEFSVKWEGIGGEVGQTASRISAWRGKIRRECLRPLIHAQSDCGPEQYFESRKS